MTVIHSFPYLFGTDSKISKNDVISLIRLLEEPVMDVDDPLEGRATAVHTHIESLGAVVIKHYHRGGIIRKFNKNTYLRSGKPRSRREYEILEEVRHLGVNAPEPLIWAIRGGLFYKAFLVTREIPDAESLMNICRSNEERSAGILKKAACDIAILIKNKIHHVDLHPGNILSDHHDKVFIIDFDKTEKSRLSPEKLVRSYLSRWERAINKYQLPHFMKEIMRHELSAHIGI